MHFKIITFFIFLVLTHFTYANEYTVEQAYNKYNELGVKIPPIENDGRIQTLNQKGAMSPIIDNTTKKFIEFGKGKKVLEIGGAYGQVMIAMLQQYPNTIYHMNDLDKRHLFISAKLLRDNISDDRTLTNTRLFDFDIAGLLQLHDKYDAILIARVLHFFSPTQLDKAIHNIYTLLQPGGRVYVIAITPYVKRFKKFIPEYEKRLAAFEEYPGYVKSLEEWVDKENTSSTQLSALHKESFMFLDDKVLLSKFKKQGFNILECSIVPLEYNSSSFSLDGRENVILIAEKPI